MLNGKFYMGLTANQMTRKSDGVDRQKSSFFWPDETDTVPKTYRKPTSRNGTPQNATTASPAATPEREIRPKELFHKQLTSKIEFCDDIQKSPLPTKRNSSTAYRSTAKDSPAKQLNNHSTPNESFTKPNTFLSKIEFYDYDDIPTVGGISTPIVKRFEDDNLKSQKSPSSPKNNVTDRKKITFEDRSVKKSILKNNEVRPTRNVEHNIAIDRLPQFKKNIDPKRNLSKSVENISKLDISSDRSPVRNNNSTTPAAKERYAVSSKEPQTKMEYRQEQEEHYSTSSNNHSNYEEPSKVVQKSRKTVRNDYSYLDNHGTNNSYTHEETYNDWSDQNGHIQRNADYQRHSPNNRSPNNRRYSNQADNYQAHHRNSPNTTKSPNHLPRDDYDDYSSSRNGSRRYTPNPVQEERSSNGRSDARHHSAKQYDSPIGLVIPQYPNEASIRAHSHLKSNIFFNDNSYVEERPRSVRETAVARVGVGLPNI